MSKRVAKHDPWRSCESKVRHDTEERARAEYRGQVPYPGGKWHAYRCVHCRGWHVSSGVMR